MGDQALGKIRLGASLLFQRVGQRSNGRDILFPDDKEELDRVSLAHRFSEGCAKFIRLAESRALSAFRGAKHPRPLGDLLHRRFAKRFMADPSLLAVIKR